MPELATIPPTERPAAPNRPGPNSALVRAVVLLDVGLGFWASVIAAGYVYLRLENYRMMIGGSKVNESGVFHALMVNARWAATIAGLGEIPGGPHNAIPGAPDLGVFAAYRVMTMFVALAAGYLALAAAWFALADGLSHGLRWARRAHVILGWLGLATVAAYAVLYVLSPHAPRAGLLIVAGSAAVPIAMIRAGQTPRDLIRSGRPRRLGLPAWSLVAAGLLLLALAMHVVLAWWSLLLIKAYGLRS